MIKLSLPAATALILACTPTPATAQSFALDFDDGVPEWRIVLDGVMGGLSKARVGTAEPGVLSFTGTLSLENNGGFAQMRRPVDGARFADAAGVVLECRGDGRTYDFDIRASNARVMAGGYRARFDTVAGEWTEIRLPFESFRLQSFGRAVRNAPALDPRRIESIGVTLADKQPGEFRLDVRSIATFDAAAGNELIAAAEAAGLTTLLQCVTAARLDLPTTPITVFAPSNDAFAKLPEGTIAALLEPENRATLTRVLGLHVVEGRLAASELLAGRRLTTLAGESIEVALRGGRLEVGGAAKVVRSDVEAGSAVIHVIDRVLLPPAEPAPAAAAAGERDAVAAAVALYSAAIDRGVPLFNSGNTAACAAVYDLAVESMILLGGRDLGNGVLEHLVASRRELAGVTAPRERAWALRRVLDEAWFMLRRAERAGQGDQIPRIEPRNPGAR